MEKPKLTAIDGGRKGPPEPPDHAAETARYHLGRLIVELLRALARGDDSRSLVGRELVAVAEHLLKANSTLGEIIEPVIRQLHDDLTKDIKRDGLTADRENIVLAGLQVAAESCAGDPAAQGRVSQRERSLIAAVENYFIVHEGRSRENGWSYLKELEKRNFPRDPKRPR